MGFWAEPVFQLVLFYWANFRMRDRLRVGFQGWLLIGFMLLGLILRLDHLASKPLWMDEVITAIFSLGRTYFDLPIDQTVSLETIAQVFTLNPTTCRTIAETVATQSVHPPLFFCWMHSWLSLLQPWHLQTWGLDWVWQLRSLPAFVGVGTIAVVYWLNRLAFSPRAGLFAAALMAVSPFAVYLSQEARHYTVPMLVITLALVALVRIQQDWRQWRYDWRPWTAWLICNAVGFYLHYFCLLATIAQIGTLALLWLLNRRHQLVQTSRSQAIQIIISCSVLIIFYLPIFPTFLSHINRPETDWMKPFESSFWTAIAPLYQMPIGWLLMVVALPVEHQPLPRAIAAGLVMVLVGLGLGIFALGQWRSLTQAVETRASMVILGSFTGIVVLEFLAIAFILHKDLTQVPRYNFIYYPAVCALLGAALAQVQSKFAPVHPWQPWSIIAIGVISSLCVSHNLALQKPFRPDQVAQQILAVSPQPQVVMAYDDFQDIALGTAFALALRSQSLKNAAPETLPIPFSLLSRQQGYDRLWQQLTQLPDSDWIWLIAPELRQREFPRQIQLIQRNCQPDPQHYHRIGIPYQAYRCPPPQ
jgi:uncharacterized membrane protein